jgi:hypothetical protein
LLDIEVEGEQWGCSVVPSLARVRHTKEVLEPLPSKAKALSSTPLVGPKKKKRRRKKMVIVFTMLVYVF